LAARQAQVLVDGIGARFHIESLQLELDRPIRAEPAVLPPAETTTVASDTTTLQAAATKVTA
jgi:hypothetical protein